MNRGAAYFIGYAIGCALGLLTLASILFLSVELLAHVAAVLGS